MNPDTADRFARGELVVLLDDHPDPRPAVLVALAAALEPAAMAELVRYTSGFVTVALPAARCDALGLPALTHDPFCRLRPVAAVAVDARVGVGTGISATDRCRTARVLADPRSVTSDLSRPGHVVPMRVPMAAPRRSAQRAQQVCRRAGELSLSGHAPAQAVLFLEHAHALQAGDSELLLSLGTAHQRAGSCDKAVTCCTEALAIESDGQRRARILLLLADVERSRWNLAQADAAVERGLSELQRPLPKPGVRGVLSLLFHLLAGIAAGLTGWGFGSAQDEERERDALTVALHTAGGRIAATGMRPGRRLLHSLLGLPALNRLGAGSDYTAGMCEAGFTISMLRMPSIGARLMSEAKRAARAMNDPHLMALTEWEDGACRYLTGRDDGQLWEDVLRQHGRWLDSRRVSEAITSLALEAAVMGRATEAATQLDRLSAVNDHTGPGPQAEAALAHVCIVADQGQRGQPHQDAAARFFALAPNPRAMNRVRRLFFVVHAFGRLAQCQALPTGASQELGPAVRRARVAVKRLRRTAATATTQAFGQVAAAQLDVLDGHAGRALRRLKRIRPPIGNAPILDYELACTTARALAAAGFGDRARQQARTARQIAQDAGLAERVRSISQEFALAEPASEGAETG